MNKDFKVKFLKRRILLDLLLLFGVFLFPMWLEFLIVTVMIFIFNDYYEALFLAIIADAVYSVPVSFLPIPAMYTLIMTSVFVVSIFLKRRLIYNL